MWDITAHERSNVCSYQVPSLNVKLCPADVPQLYTPPCPMTWSPMFSHVMNRSVCLSTSPYSEKKKKSPRRVIYSAACPAYPQCLGFSLISSRPQPRVFVRSASPLPSTRGSDQCSFSRSLVMRCAEPLGATWSLAYPCSPSAGEASHIPN